MAKAARWCHIMGSCPPPRHRSSDTIIYPSARKRTRRRMVQVQSYSCSMPRASKPRSSRSASSPTPPYSHRRQTTLAAVPLLLLSPSPPSHEPCTQLYSFYYSSKPRSSPIRLINVLGSGFCFLVDSIHSNSHTDTPNLHQQWAPLRRVSPLLLQTLPNADCQRIILQTTQL